MNSCKNCKEPVDWDYCPKCGQPVHLKRIDHNYIIQELGDFFFANKGMVYTIKNVLIRPGESVRRFIAEDRYRFVKPITFLFLTSLVYVLVAHIFKISLEDVSPIKMDAAEDVPATFANWLFENPRYMLTIAVFFVALWVKIFFRKAGYNFFEIFILMCFVFGIATLMDTVGVIIHALTPLNATQTSIVGIIFQIWAIGQFFDRKKAASYAKALLSFLFGMIMLGILVAIATIIEIAIK